MKDTDITKIYQFNRSFNKFKEMYGLAEFTQFEFWVFYAICKRQGDSGCTYEMLKLDLKKNNRTGSSNSIRRVVKKLLDLDWIFLSNTKPVKYKTSILGWNVLFDVKAKIHPKRNRKRNY